MTRAHLKQVYNVHDARAPKRAHLRVAGKQKSVFKNKRLPLKPQHLCQQWNKSKQLHIRKCSSPAQSAHDNVAQNNKDFKRASPD